MLSSPAHFCYIDATAVITAIKFGCVEFLGVDEILIFLFSLKYF